MQGKLITVQPQKRSRFHSAVTCVGSTGLDSARQEKEINWLFRQGQKDQSPSASGQGLQATTTTLPRSSELQPTNLALLVLLGLRWSHRHLLDTPAL